MSGEHRNAFDDQAGIRELMRLRQQFSWQIEDFAKHERGVWVANGGGSSELSFPRGFNERLSQIEAVSPWYVARNEIIHLAFQKVLREDSAIWDVGAGTGFVGRHLMASGREVIAVEPSRDGAFRIADVVGLPTIEGKFEDLHLPNASIGAVGCFDVLEHLAEPRALCVEIARVLKPGACFVMTVPAFTWLWSKFDTETGHFARYTRSSVDRLTTGLPLRCVWTSYFMSPYVLPVLLLRTLRDRLLPSADREAVLERSLNQIAGPTKIVNQLLSWLLFCEKKAIERVRLPVGTSLICAFVKQ